MRVFVIGVVLAVAMLLGASLSGGVGAQTANTVNGGDTLSGF